MDVAIIGAGINGASAAQHLSAAGYSVLVVDQGDFADGATSRSSRLLHCGLRRLADGWACDQGTGLGEPIAQHVAPILSSARRRPGQDTD